MAMNPGPGYATDQQLRGMAQGGLPSAVNEEIMRLSMRRGAQVMPQSVHMPGVRQPGKMKPKDMINDFVTRVRAQNEANQNSLVPKGTPMQQGPAPQPQDSPQPRQQGIAGYASGGVRGFQKGAAPYKSDANWALSAGAPSPFIPTIGTPFYELPEDKLPPKIIPKLQKDKDGILAASPTETPLPSDKKFEVPPNWSPNMTAQALAAEGNVDYLNAPVERAPWQEGPWYDPTDALGYARAKDLREKFNNPQAHQSGPPQGIAASIEAAMKSSGPNMSGIALPKMGAMPELPEFKQSPFVDPIKARADAIAAGKDEIDAQVKPFDDITKEAESDLEESKRSSFWNAVLKASMVAMQAGGPSNDPASADLFSIAGKSLEGYVSSLEKDKAYQDKIKADIRGYKVAGSQARAQATNNMGQVGVTSAQMQNNYNIVGDQNRSAYDLSIFKEQGDRIRAQYGVDANIYLGRMQMSVEKWKAEMSAKTGIDPEWLRKVAHDATSLGVQAYKDVLASAPDGQVTDEVIARAEARSVAATSEYLSMVPGDYGGVGATKMRQRPGVARSMLDEDTQKMSKDFPDKPTWGSEGIPISYDGQSFSGY